MKKASLLISGMSCQHCVMSVKKELEKAGVQTMQVGIGKAIIEYDEKVISSDNFPAIIEEAGFSLDSIQTES